MRSEEEPLQSTTPPAEGYRERPSIVKYHLYHITWLLISMSPLDVPTGRFGLMCACAITPILTLYIDSLVNLEARRCWWKLEWTVGRGE